MNQILVSSDHHANWEALELLFIYAKDNQLPFVINGDIIGDYNFETLADELGIHTPFEISEEEILSHFDEEYTKAYLLYQQVQEHGEEGVINQVPPQMMERAKASIAKALQLISSAAFSEKLNQIQDALKLKHESVLKNHTVKLKALYKVIVRTHAKKLAKLIDETKVKTYFLPGNHEPVNFVSVVHEYMKDKTLLIDLGTVNGVQNVNGIRIAGVSNVAALMPFLSKIYSDNELNKLFSHQKGVARPILFKNVNINTVMTEKMDLHKDPDWNRLMPNGEEQFDVFFSHGQVGEGAWRDIKRCPEVPTLLVAAMLSYLSKLTVDGHLHTSHEMKNQLGKPTIRGVGNVGYVVSKDAVGTVSYKKKTFDAPYNARGGMKLRELDKSEIVMSDLIWD